MILRTQTYLQFGQSNKSIGAVLMLNPGSAMLADPGEANRLMTPNVPVTGLVKSDPTMDQLAELVRALYPNQEVQGRLQIYNLFSYREGNMNKFKTTWNKMSSSQRSTIAEKPLLDEYEHPWILVGWGCGQPKKWDEYKKAWLAAIRIAGTAKLGWRHPEQDYSYYHPCPQMMDKRQPYIDYIVEQHNSLVVYPTAHEESATTLETQLNKM